MRRTDGVAAAWHASTIDAAQALDGQRPDAAETAQNRKTTPGLVVDGDDGVNARSKTLARTFMSSRNFVSTFGLSKTSAVPMSVTFWPSFKSMAMPDLRTLRQAPRAMSFCRIGTPVFDCKSSNSLSGVWPGLISQGNASLPHLTQLHAAMADIRLRRSRSGGPGGPGG